MRRSRPDLAGSGQRGLADGLRQFCLDEFDVAGDHAKRPHHRSPDNAVTARAVTGLNSHRAVFQDRLGDDEVLPGHPDALEHHWAVGRDGHRACHDVAHWHQLNWGQ